MKAVRTLRAVLLLVVLVTFIIFLAALNDMNPYPILLPPLRLAVAPLWVVLGALLLGWLSAWIPARVRIWSLNRTNRRLQKRLQGLESPSGRHRPHEPSAAVIPDRGAALSAKPLLSTEPDHG